MAQIQIRVGTNTKRSKKVYDSGLTPKKVLESEGIEYGAATITLDGCPLSAKEMNQTFDDFNIKDECQLIAVIKADNAR